MSSFSQVLQCLEIYQAVKNIEQTLNKLAVTQKQSFLPDQRVKCFGQKLTIHMNVKLMDFEK